ncbi:restriction endonuclease subunit S [Acetobacterium wieringae]|uniref:Restriction endonuclease subunit S n=1 Tax=Acetobacterium wieringae TaxID=52694 RepID=A0ABY6HCW3_9FIRM|nr:restriction endonuclease subunit S [Acetobacterium wieringae]UYO62190.1 restriction endonuclease subunit S [Acetobacterium wieringae]VUZ26084.1 Type-1 restriction enzyme EcoKI specificity protein [Acetobacterium wieringae]
MAKKKQELTVEEKLAAALVREDEQPYEVPENWVWTKLNILYNFIDYRGKTPHKISSGVPLITAKNVKQGYIDYSIAEFISHEEYLTRQTRGISHKGDILFTTEAPLGNVAIADLDEFSAGQRLITLQKYPHSAAINNKFYVFYMLSGTFKKDIDDRKTGTTVAGIKAEKLKLVPVPLPPLAEQQRIVDRIESLFDQLDQAKALIQEALDSFATRKAAILHQAFTGALTKKWREDHGVGLESWEVDSLKNLCEVITDGTHQTPHYSTTGYVFLSSKNVTSGKIDWENIKYIPEELHNKLYARLAPQLDDILLAKNGTTGIGAIVDRDCVFDIYVSLALLRPIKSRITSKYLLYSINNPITKNKFNHELTGIGVQNLHLRDIRATTIPVPGLGEQQEIVRILDDLFEKEQAAQDLCDQIDQIETIKKTILGKAFRGELGTNVVGEESAVELLKDVL